ncbi:Glycosyltransferase involved in cell wall bisynthesis [Chitinophaga sp. YR627]|uniref:glycosyltransferase family 4 protein n=1 Tax=Chitinophaga sp. YR627 TaxID=1881041 RepID=UPI0008F08FA2|nr:glycosyltransferase family 4 protein [Chitinophaga sp. YR627]SFM77119.1 Glycosyltransferase involved in cell wall bisynthesis [Chitinophaga sp. YR627]
MKIGIVSIIKEPWGGSEELWADMAAEALKEGHEVFVSALKCGPPHPKTVNLLQHGAKLFYRRGFVKPGIPFLQRIFRKGLIILANKLQNPFHRLFKERPDVIFYVGTSYSIGDDILLLKALDKTHAALYINCNLNHDVRGFGSTRYDLINAAYQRAKKVLFVSEGNLEIARRHLCSNIDNAMVIRNPVNLSNIGILPFPKEETVHFAMVGLLVTDHKGQDLVLGALHQEQWRDRKWHLNIYGAGLDEGYLKQLTAFYGLNDRVTFHGKVNDIREVWKKNSLLLMPSRQEGMPLAVVEAMVCGRPSVLTDVGGHREWVTEGQQGFISPGATVRSMADAMERAWEKRADWEKMGIAANTAAMERYNPAPGKTILNLLLNA